MIHKNTLRYSLYATAIIVILTLTGIFGNFAKSPVIEGQVYFSSVILVIMLGGTAYLTGVQAQYDRPAATITNSMIGSGLAGLALVILVVLNTQVDMGFMFQNMGDLSDSTLTFGQPVSLDGGEIGGLILLLLFSLGIGAVTGLLVRASRHMREVLFLSAVLTVIFGLTVGQLDDVITLVDAIVLMTMFILTYIIGWRFTGPLSQHLLRGFATGAAFAVVLAIVANMGALDEGGLLRGSGDLPIFLGMTVNGNTLAFVVLLGIFGAAGALISGAPTGVHNNTIYFFTVLVALGIFNWQGNMSLLAAALTFALFAGAFWIVPDLGRRAGDSFEEVSRPEQRTVYFIMILATTIVLIVAPQFMGLYITNVFNLIVLYAIMGLGLNVMIGYTGLLDLGYVASFAIGAYTLGILTTPSLLTCGGVHPDDIPFPELEATCTGAMTFWQAIPFCVLVSAITGMMLGIPVLRLRGDYLAIVTLGFGEITNRLIKSNTAKPLLGGPQGISPIPSPTLDLSFINESWVWTLNDSVSIYYLFLFSIVATTFVVYRLSNSRTGRAWRAVRADEDVAQAMGINLVQTKLLAFGVSSAFAGLGGAVFGASVQGIFPDSFTLLISINVLSLIIIGGMGSITGVILGAVLLRGMPELLRELDNYRLLAFGVILITVMLIKPDGLLPPKPRAYAERAAELKAEREQAHGE